MLTIGELARATGLSAKALRLYDDLGLVPPARVDPVTGYRYYEPGQVEPARLVARLRSAGVPLASIAVITGADAPETAVAVLLSWWRQVEADTASARAVVTTLVDELRGQETTMSTTTTAVRSAHRAGEGARGEQRDDLYPRTSRLTAQVTGQRLFVVADGSGDGAAVAGLALDALEALDGAEPGADPLADLDAAVSAGAAAVEEVGDGATTLTALVLLADRALLAHVGDSRAHLVRAGRLERLTRDHTTVQSLVDEGRLTEEEADVDPRRVLLNRAIGQGAPWAPDLSVRTLEPGDRLVLTTKGVHGVLARDQLADLLLAAGDAETVAGAVEDAVLAAGAPDNYAVVVVDV